MGFVVEEIPFGDKIVLDGAEVVVGIGESFHARTEEGVMLPNLESAGPDDLSDIAGFRAARLELATDYRFHLRRR